MSETQSDPAHAARVLAWNAVQWLARLAQSYTGAAELRWVEPARIVTPELVPGLAVGLSPATLVLQFDEGGKPSPHPLELDEKSSYEVEAWILVETLHRGLDRERFSKALPYMPAALMTGEEPKYMAQDFADALRQLGDELGAAATALSRTRERLDAGAGDLVCWPEHLEIGFSLPAPAGPPLRIVYASGASSDGHPGFRVLRGVEASDLPRDLPHDDVAAHLADLVAEIRAR